MPAPVLLRPTAEDTDAARLITPASVRVVFAAAWMGTSFRNWILPLRVLLPLILRSLASPGTLAAPAPLRVRLSVLAIVRLPMPPARSRVAPSLTVVVLATFPGAAPSALLCSTRSTPWLTVTAPAKVLSPESVSRPASPAGSPLIRPPRPLMTPERTTLPMPFILRLRAVGVAPNCRLRLRLTVSVLPAALRMMLTTFAFAPRRLIAPLQVLLPRRLASAPPTRFRARLR